MRPSSVGSVKYSPSLQSSRAARCAFKRKQWQDFTNSACKRNKRLNNFHPKSGRCGATGAPTCYALVCRLPMRIQDAYLTSSAKTFGGRQITALFVHSSILSARCFSLYIRQVAVSRPKKRIKHLKKRKLSTT
jgi:hypothetical protein